MKLEFTFRPIAVWPGKIVEPRASKFKASYSDTLALLDRELQNLGAGNIFLQVALSSSEIRQDGRPRADARPRHPGVILCFDSKHGPLSYPCCAYKSWEDNLRAIALSLEHLRAVDRYGVTKRGEQYQGWAALTGPAPEPGAITTKADAWTFLHEHSSVKGKFLDSDQVKAAYRECVKKLHPDVGGDDKLFKRLQDAKTILEIQ